MVDMRVATLTGLETTLSEATIAAFKGSLRGELLTAADAGYEAARKIWNDMIDRHPALIARCAGGGARISFGSGFQQSQV